MTWQIMRSIHFELHTTLFLCECVIYSIFLDVAKAKHFYSICASFALAQAQTHFVYFTRIVWRACGIWKTVTVITIMAAPAQPTLPFTLHNTILLCHSKHDLISSEEAFGFVPYCCHSFRMHCAGWVQIIHLLVLIVVIVVVASSFLCRNSIPSSLSIVWVVLL